MATKAKFHKRCCGRRGCAGWRTVPRKNANISCLRIFCSKLFSIKCAPSSLLPQGGRGGLLPAASIVSLSQHFAKLSLSFRLAAGHSSAIGGCGCSVSWQPTNCQSLPGMLLYMLLLFLLLLCRAGRQAGRTMQQQRHLIESSDGSIES